MAGESPSETSARVFRRVQQGASLSDYSPGELWAIVRHRSQVSWRTHVYSMMKTLTGDFDAQKAVNVIAAVLTRNGHDLLEDGSLSSHDLAAFLRLC